MRALLLMLLAVPVVARAQLVSVTPGARVRVDAPSISTKLMKGTLVATSAETLLVDVPTRNGGTATEQTKRWAIPTQSLRQLDVSSGQSHANGAKRGAKTGLLIGVLYTAAALATEAGSGYASEGQWGAGTALAFGAAFTVASTTLGAAIGSAFSVERWKRVYSSASQRAATP